MTRHFGIPINAAVKPPEWSNPEAPMNDLTDHWHEPPPTHGGWWSLLIVALAVVLAGIAVYSCAAHAHMPDRPDLDAWFNSLGADGASCCSYIDGTTIAVEDYVTAEEFEKHHCRMSLNKSVSGGPYTYCVHLYDDWWLVPERTVVKEANKFGLPVVWHAWGWEGATKGVDFIRCFLPGAGA